MRASFFKNACFFLVLTVNNSTFYKGNKDQRAASTSDNNSLEGDVPVVRRKDSQKKEGFKAVTTTLDDEEVYKRLREMSQPGKPQDRYTIRLKTDRFTRQKGPHVLGAGASGTVVLATDETTSQNVAIKMIDLPKQQKKSLLLMELKVGENITLSDERTVMDSLFYRS